MTTSAPVAPRPRALPGPAVVASADRRLHLSLSNLPLEEWADGVTMCWQRVELYRLQRIPRRAPVCPTCLAEAAP